MYLMKSELISELQEIFGLFVLLIYLIDSLFLLHWFP